MYRLFKTLSAMLLAGLAVQVDLAAAQKRTLDGEFHCGGRYKKSDFILSRYGSYLVCGGSQSHDYRVNVVSILDKPGRVYTFDVPIEKERIFSIDINAISHDEQHTLLTRYATIDGYKHSQARLFLGNNQRGDTVAITKALPGGCTVSGAALSNDGRAVVYSVNGLEFKTDFNTMTSTRHGCTAQYVGYHRFDIGSQKTNKLLQQVSETMLTYAPIISADSNTTIVTGDSTYKAHAVSLGSDKPSIALAKKTWNSDLQARGAFYRQGFAGTDFVFGTQLKSSQSPDVPVGSVGEVLAVAPLDGGDLVELSLELMSEDDNGTVHAGVSASPQGNWLTFFKIDSNDGNNSVKGLFSIPSGGGDPIFLDKVSLGEPTYSEDDTGVVYELDKQMVYSRLDGSKRVIYDTRIEYFGEEAAKNARHNVVKVHRGRSYFKADNLSEECGKGWAGLYSVPLEGGEVVPVMPPFTKHCEVYDFTFSKDGKSIIYISSIGRGLGYIFHQADIADHGLQTELWSLKP